MSLVIERLAEPITPITQGERDYAEIQQKPQPERIPKYYFRHKETGAEYSWIEGAFSPPGYQYPGYAVIIGMDRQEDPKYKTHFIRGLEEFETEQLTDIEGLIKGCIALKGKYGAYPLLEQGFYSELTEATSERVYNTISRLYGEKSEFWPIPGPYSEHPQSFQQYVMTLAHYKKILDISQCPKLKNYMLMIKDGRDLLKMKPEENPAIAAIAYAVSTLIHMRPWQFESYDAVWEMEDEY